jgi:hypothetical protein
VVIREGHGCHLSYLTDDRLRQARLHLTLHWKKG